MIWVGQSAGQEARLYFPLNLLQTVLPAANAAPSANQLVRSTSTVSRAAVTDADGDVEMSDGPSSVPSSVSVISSAKPDGMSPA